MRKLIPIITLAALTGSIAIAEGAAHADCPVSNYLVQTGPGDTSGDVECLQQSLNEQGYDSGPVDGWFGPITEAAVISYQSALGLTVDGEVGSETAGALGVWGSSNDSVESAESGWTDETITEEESTDLGVGVYWPWDALAQCESGGDWGISTGNGYYGGLQFSLSSWQAAGGSGYPHEHSASEQVHRGEILQDMQGWNAWPTCARIVGLL